MALANTAEKDTKPWWKYGYLWLVISGPTVVMVAGFYTLWIAIDSPNIVLTDESSRRGAEVQKNTEKLDDTQKALDVLMPALKGRNHAATPVSDRPAN